MSKIVSAISILASMAGLLVLFCAIAYCWRNHSGHTGFNPFLIALFFSPILLLGFLGTIFTLGQSPFPKSAAATGFLGVAFPFFITKLGILNEYGVWIDARMPDRNPHAALLLAGFAIVVGIFQAIAFLIPPKSRAKENLAT